MHSVRDALVLPWVMDIDATVKPLYGHQKGAEIGYNPHKPGRPSHVLHTLQGGRPAPGSGRATQSPGKERSSGHAKAALGRLLDELGERGPALVRGDCGYGFEAIIDVCEQRGKSYLLRLRKTANVKRLIERLSTRQDWTRATQASQGWQATQDSLKLVGWSKARRVVVLRRRVKNDLALTVKKRGTKGKSEPGQMVLALPADEVQDSAQMWAYTVLVTDVKYELAAIGQLYRDRCDCRTCQVCGFDEPQRQWGWGGFTTQDMHRSQATARAVALHHVAWKSRSRPEAARHPCRGRIRTIARRAVPSSGRIAQGAATKRVR